MRDIFMATNQSPGLEEVSFQSSHAYHKALHAFLSGDADATISGTTTVISGSAKSVRAFINPVSVLRQDFKKMKVVTLTFACGSEYPIIILGKTKSAKILMDLTKYINRPRSDEIIEIVQESHYMAYIKHFNVIVSITVDDYNGDSPTILRK